MKQCAGQIPLLDRRDALILGIQIVVGQNWFPMILAGIMLGSEVTTSVWGSILTRESRRGRHVSAKLGVMSFATWKAALLVIGAWVAAAILLTDWDSGFSGADWFGVAWKTGIVQLTWVALGLAAIAWVRSIGLAIGIVVAFSFGEGILALWSVFRSVSLGTASGALFGEITADVSGGIGIGVVEAMSFTRAIVVVPAWALTTTVAAYAGLRIRDA